MRQRTQKLLETLNQPNPSHVALYLSYLQTGVRDHCQRMWVEAGCPKGQHAENALFTDVWDQGHLEWNHEIMIPLATFAAKLSSFLYATQETWAVPYLTDTDFCYNSLEPAGNNLAAYAIKQQWNSNEELLRYGQFQIAYQTVLEFPECVQEQVVELIQNQFGIAVQLPPKPGSLEWITQYAGADVQPFKYKLGQQLHFYVKGHDRINVGTVTAICAGPIVTLTAEGLMKNTANVYRMGKETWLYEHHLFLTAEEARANPVPEDRVIEHPGYLQDFTRVTYDGDALSK